MKEAIWPIFIAAPFISPSTDAIFSAVSRWRVSSRSALLSSERPRLAAAVPAYRVAWPPIAAPSFAERPILLAGMAPDCSSRSAASRSLASAARRPSSRGIRTPRRSSCGSCSSSSFSVGVGGHRFKAFFYPGSPLTLPDGARRHHPATPTMASDRPTLSVTAARHLRYARHPAPAPAGPDPRRRLRPRRRGAALPGLRAGPARPCSARARPCSTSRWRARRPSRS